jgi:membrane protein implicated in regulation of membrane protease activity
MRQLRYCFGVLLVRIGKMARESLLVAALILSLLLLLVRELVLLLMLLAGAGVENSLAVLLMLQFGRNLTLGRDVASVLAVSNVLSRVGRRFCVRRRDRPDGRVLDVL